MQRKHLQGWRNNRAMPQRKALDMNCFVCIISFGLLVTTSLVASPARANHVHPADGPSQTGQGDEPEKKASKKENKKESTDTKNDSGAAQFEDRDGDGINDGKEHRFRKKSKRQHRKERKRMLRRKKKSGKSRARNN